MKKIKSIVKNSFFLTILLLLTANLGAESKWVKLSKTDREKAFKEFDYDKVKKTLTAKYNYAKEVTVPYSMCQEAFPDLPGQFPCSFLSDEHSIKKSVEDVNSEAGAGGRIGIRISKEKNLIGGKVFLVGEDQSSDGTVNEDMLQVFYLKNNYISHYTYKDQLILFKWTGKKGEETLVSILLVKFDKNKEVSFSKRIDF
ncbi:MAG: hypothetical protein KBF99_02655 [Leptospiraceae bacterium]|nr:hypothetical protein [Leptospiraceae bacterium]MBK7055422.1 hypothetical protein [Leptospiraceae bacterium]MBL0264514.1 hypothetical protein [Leptospiraceae bacterium]MBP9162048.1 hypothetical protein [Leptospiraceae bacterium]